MIEKEATIHPAFLLQQTQDIATATGGSTARGFSLQNSKLESESYASLSILAENAIVVMMLVEDHLRLQSQLYSSSHSVDCHGSPISLPSSTCSRSNSGRIMGDLSETLGSRRSSVSSESGAPSLEVCRLLYLPVLWWSIFYQL